MLLMLTEKDLREKPLEISCLGDIKRIANAISMLHETNHSSPEVLKFTVLLNWFCLCQKNWCVTFLRKNGRTLKHFLELSNWFRFFYVIKISQNKHFFAKLLFITNLSFAVSFISTGFFSSMDLLQRHVCLGRPARPSLPPWATGPRGIPKTWLFVWSTTTELCPLQTAILGF